MANTFPALLVKEENGAFTRTITEIPIDQLPEGELLVKVGFSSINYKDMLSASGNKGVTRKFPHVPGVDAAGTIVASKSPEFPVGSEVIVTGFDLGMNTWGGFGGYIRVPAHWAILLPAGLSGREAMSYGTAGLTAGLSVHKLLIAGLTPDKGKVAVSGASGGVGSISVAILAKLGFDVTVISGKADPDFFTKTLGAKEIIDRNEFVESYNKKPLSSPIFAGGIDTVGGDILSGMLKATKYGGTVTCCGMVASGDLQTSIFPFILRGVSLAGTDSVETPVEIRKIIWEKLANDWKPNSLGKLTTEITLEELPDALDTIAAGKVKGRFILRHG